MPLPEPLQWREIIKTIGRAAGKDKLAVPVPASMVKLTAAMFEGFEMFPLSRDQLIMLLEGNTCDSAVVFDDFAIEPIPFNEETLAYLRR
jgi:hypothetical protein